MPSAVNPRRERPSARPPRAGRRGTILVMAAFMMIVIMALLALSVDLGYITTVRSELKRATDSAALAGAGTLIDGSEAAELQAFKFLARNPVGGVLIAEQEDWEELAAQWIAEHPDEFDVQVGHWYPDNPKPQPGDEDDPRFVESDYLPSTIRVRTLHSNAPLFFAKLIGQNSFSMKAESIARYQPRDIAVVLDFSASMNVDSQLSRITSSGENREVVEASLLQIYQELGSPTYGSMQFTPQYISSYYNYTIKQELGLTYVPYPYPSGNWDDYINYVKTNYNVSRAGYQKKYGYLTLVNYWLERQPMYNQTPDLWKGSAEPAASVKDATNVFMDYIQEVDCDDRVSLVVYSSPSPAQDAVLEHGLTDDFASVQSTVQHRQAGHYDFYTNIGAGIRVGREELDDNARVGAKKMIVLMTDGQANRPYNTTYARTYALNQADLAAAARYPIVTISLGASADEVLMQDIANRTNGVHFNIPSDGSVTNYREQLLAIFRQIADDRPLVLVK